MLRVLAWQCLWCVLVKMHFSPFFICRILLPVQKLAEEKAEGS